MAAREPARLENLRTPPSGIGGSQRCRGLTGVAGGTISTMRRGRCLAARRANSAARDPFLPKGGLSPMMSWLPSGRSPAYHAQLSRNYFCTIIIVSLCS